MTSYSIELPLDSDGYIRRECPSCRTEFKCHYGPTEDTPEDAVDPSFYYCPLCGKSAALDAWFTTSQIEYITAFGMREFLDELNDEMKGSVNSLNSGLLRVEMKTNPPPIPNRLHEPDDMTIISSPCHPWEPVKVPEEANAPYYCLICGAIFAV